MKKQNAIPHDTTAESYVIGSLMLHSDLIDEWDELNAEYFYLPAHQTILAAIVAVRAGGGHLRPVEPAGGELWRRADPRPAVERTGLEFHPGLVFEIQRHGPSLSGGPGRAPCLLDLRGGCGRRR